MKFPKLLIELLLIIGLLATGEAHAVDAGAIARGKYLYEAADCYSCHGGPRGAPG